jgi:phosphate-selective porin OprO/OprP
VKNIFSLIVTLLLCIVSFSALAQGELDERAMIYKFKGLQFATKDSSFYINFRFRMQNRLGLYSNSATDLGIKEVEARVRRLRMRIDGFIMTRKLAYSIQLSFSRGDTDFENTGFVNIVRDAVIFYHFTPKFYVAFGQNKLPGNRQRVNSSGQLQFAERSIVNGTFNIDRDFGIKAYYKNHVGNMWFNLKGAVTTGEGRSVNFTTNGLAYTGRMELLPLGEFTKEGDYSEGDLEREPKPKISLAGGYSYNHKAVRTGGQLGKELYAPRTFGVLITDLMFKFKGWAYAAEYMKRIIDNPYTVNDDGLIRYVYSGQGTNHQLSYLFKRNYEVAFRYSLLLPDKIIAASEMRTEVLELGATKYINKHRVKLQLSALYNIKGGNYSVSNPMNN